MIGRVARSWARGSLARRHVAAADRERGITMAELLVTMAVTGLVAVLTATLVVGVQRASKENSNRQDQITSARVAVEGMSRTLRASVKPNQIAVACSTCADNAFLTGYAARVQFYSNVDNPGNSSGPRKVTYAVETSGPNKGNLVETIQKPNSATPGASGYVYCVLGSAGCADKTTTRVLARGVQTTAPLFTYYGTAGALMTPPVNGTLSVADLKKVTAVEVAVSVQEPGSHVAEPTTYIQRIMLPNAQAVMKIEE